jgi:hypothetical protein
MGIYRVDSRISLGEFMRVEKRGRQKYNWFDKIRRLMWQD